MADPEEFANRTLSDDYAACVKFACDHWLDISVYAFKNIRPRRIQGLVMQEIQASKQQWVELSLGPVADEGDARTVADLLKRGFLEESEPAGRYTVTTKFFSHLAERLVTKHRAPPPGTPEFLARVESLKATPI